MVQLKIHVRNWSEELSVISTLWFDWRLGAFKNCMNHLQLFLGAYLVDWRFTTKPTHSCRHYLVLAGCCCSDFWLRLVGKLEIDLGLHIIFVEIQKERNVRDLRYRFGRSMTMDLFMYELSIYFSDLLPFAPSDRDDFDSHCLFMDLYGKKTSHF